MLLVPAATDKESMSHPHRHKLTNTYTHTLPRLLKKYGTLFACFDNVNREKVYFTAT